ncbi:MAG: EAL domain-containing protein [Nitrococcus mobilis]|nr:EAL domain-containing protein [Nitrococcus mobilis]
MAGHRNADFRLSINLAAATLDRPEFLVQVEALMLQYAVDPTRVCFEITETIAIRNMTAAVEAMFKLSKQGFRYALDDFGSDAASYGYLNRLPLHYVTT